MAFQVRKSVRSKNCQAASKTAGRFSRQPEQLRRLHLRRDRAADVAQHAWPLALMRSACSTARWSIQTMMSRAGSSGGPDRQRRAARPEHDQRAGGVEADAAHVGGRNAGRGDGAAHGDADGRARSRRSTARRSTPGSRKSAMSRLADAEHPAAGVEHAGAGAAGADVDADEAVRHGCPQRSTALRQDHEVADRHAARARQHEQHAPRRPPRAASGCRWPAPPPSWPSASRRGAPSPPAPGSTAPTRTPCLAHLAPDGVDEGLHGELRGGVDRLPDHRHDAGDRARDDDVARLPRRPCAAGPRGPSGRRR